VGNTQQHRLSSISGELLKDHEQELLQTILSLLLDDAESDDWTTQLFWRTPITPYGKRLSFDTGSSPALLMLRDEVLRWVTEQNRPFVLDNNVGSLGAMHRALAEAGLCSAAMFPLAHQGSPIGALLLERRRGPSPFAFLDLAVVTLFGTLVNGIFDSLELFPQRRAKQSTLVLNHSREDSPPPKRTGSVRPPSLPSAAPPEHGFIHGIDAMQRCLPSKNQSDPAIRIVK
jgi:hypothetical protein